jgi:hypothetical protein
MQQNLYNLDLQEGTIHIIGFLEKFLNFKKYCYF